jgi:hypothetical protein
MTKGLAWAVALLAMVSVAVSMAPDLRRYIRISTM